ncbi:flavodoxin [Weissella sagaensis]|uniref:flavodoxin n=1 Tax=Weissella sagaensis TaxID=2559928 RepID=UPI0013EBADF5|nr:flavodoxin [Weissella sagaensis]
MNNNKNLIVYYSRTGNTEAVAKLIHDKLGGDVIRIETSETRPANYRQEVQQNQMEQENGILPGLNTQISSLKNYKNIFIGTPTWNMALPQAVVSFLTSNDFTGLNIFSFNTNGGYGQGTTFDQIKTLAPDAHINDGFSVKGGEESKGRLLNIKDDRKLEVSQLLDEWLNEF